MANKRMEAEFRRTRTYWGITAFGEPMGCTWNDDSYSHRKLREPGTLPTEASAQRVIRAFAKWMKDRYPDREMPGGGQYFMAFPDGPAKVGKSWKAESEAVRKKYGNCWKDQGDAYKASMALAWLCERERERFETRHNAQVAGDQERPAGPSQRDQAG